MQKCHFKGLTLHSSLPTDTPSRQGGHWILRVCTQTQYCMAHAHSPRAHTQPSGVPWGPALGYGPTSAVPVSPSIQAPLQPEGVRGTQAWVESHRPWARLDAQSPAASLRGQATPHLPAPWCPCLRVTSSRKFPGHHLGSMFETMSLTRVFLGSPSRGPDWSDRTGGSSPQKKNDCGMWDSFPGLSSYTTHSPRLGSSGTETHRHSL